MNTKSNERGIISHAQALASHTMTIAERAKYFATTAVATGGVLEIMGMGGAGIGLALLLGGTAAYFSEEIRGNIIDHLPTPGGTRLGKLNWLITGISAESAERDEQSYTVDADTDSSLVSGDGYEEELDDELDEVVSPASSGDGVRIPVAPSFREMCHLLTPERLILCYTTEGPLYGTIKDLLSMVLVGKPGRGKTTALMYLVAMLLQAHAEVHVWDPHGSLSELCGIEGLHYTDELSEIADSIDILSALLETRRKMYKESKQVMHPLLLLVDELPVVARYGKKNEPRVFEMLEKFVLEARKWNCYFIGSGQSTDADILPTIVTENLSSRVAFFTSNRRATMAGIDLDTAKRFLPLIKPDSDQMKGKMIFDCSRLSEPVLGAIPAISVKDIVNFLARNVSRRVSHVSQKASQENDGNIRVNGREMALQADEEDIIGNVFPASLETSETHSTRSQPPISLEKMEMIRKMKESNYPDREIAQLMGMSGRKYSQYKECLAYLGYRKDA